MCVSTVLSTFPQVLWKTKPQAYYSGGIRTHDLCNFKSSVIPTKQFVIEEITSSPHTACFVCLKSCLHGCSQNFDLKRNFVNYLFESLFIYCCVTCPAVCVVIVVFRYLPGVINKYLYGMLPMVARLPQSLIGNWELLLTLSRFKGFFAYFSLPWS